MTDTCRRCSECDGEEHHWMTILTDMTTFRVPCKHCDAEAWLCDECADAPVMSDGEKCSFCKEVVQ